MSENTTAILNVVRRIPERRVASYGQVAKLAGLPRNARQVGTILRQLPNDSDVPWHRVVNSVGRISSRSDITVFEGLQRHLLESEGVEFDEYDRVDLTHFQWT